MHVQTRNRTRPLDSVSMTNRKHWIAAVTLILVTGAVLRYLAATDDFWLDEIWSLQFAESAGSVQAIFEKAHDNNHHLNTLFLYLVGPRDGWFSYRCFSLVCGLGTVVLGFLIGLRRGRLLGLVTGLFLSLSFLMIVYSSEARGYGPAAFFALASFLVLERTLERETVPRILGFGGLVILGFSSHFTFGNFYLALLVWSAARYLRAPAGRRMGIFRWARLHALPSAYLVVLYLLVFRRLDIGGGPDWTLGQVFDDLTVWTLGVPRGLAPILIPALALLAALVWDSWELRKEGSDEWIFYVFATLLSWILSLLVLTPECLFARYFFVGAVFLLIMLARCVARIAAKGLAGAAIAAILAGLFCVGNAFHVVPFLRDGRGHYGDALRYMAENTKGAEISVASDHDFRNQMVVNYYKRLLPPGKTLVYHELPRFPGQGVDWILTHSQALEPDPPQVLRLPTGHVYVLRRKFPYYGPSGWHWFLYEKRG